MHKPRLGRLECVFQTFPVYFLTLCTSDRKTILANAGMHEAFRQFCRNAEKYQIWPGRYVLMPNHLHLLVAFAPDSMSISRWVKSLKNSLSKTLRGMGVPAPHWQKGFFDHLIRSEKSYSEKYDYILHDPVSGGLVEKPEDWAYAGDIFILRDY